MRFHSSSCRFKPNPEENPCTALMWFHSKRFGFSSSKHGQRGFLTYICADMQLYTGSFYSLEAALCSSFPKAHLFREVYLFYFFWLPTDWPWPACYTCGGTEDIQCKFKQKWKARLLCVMVPNGAFVTPPPSNHSKASTGLNQPH